jgi:hypothetical protein
MTQQRRQIPRSPCERELRSVLKMRVGVFSAGPRPLPALRAHPAIVARTIPDGQSFFQDALAEMLDTAINNLAYPDMHKEAIHWQFALDKKSHSQNWKERLAEAHSLAEIKETEYWRDKRDQEGNFTETSLATLLLRAIVRELDALGAGEVRSQKKNYDPPSQDTEPAMPPSVVNRISPRVIRIGRLEIDHAISIASCDKDQSFTQELMLEFEKDPRPFRPEPDEWPLLQAQLLPVLEDEARKRVIKFRDEPILDLVHIEHRSSAPNGATCYRVGVGETSYYQWAATANSLDRDLTDFPDLTKRLGHLKLREAWNCDPSSLADLTRLPAPAFIGVCVVVICEEKIMVLERQKDHHVANTAQGIPAHFMGEGMLPEDIEAGRFSPQKAAQRGCLEELGVGPTHFEFIPTGLIIDTKRWQPLFCFVGECDLTVQQLKRCMRNALHKDETGYGKILAQLPWTAQDEQTLSLLAGNDPTLSLASNHAQAALLHALYYRDGRDHVDNLLERDCE